MRQPPNKRASGVVPQPDLRFAPPLWRCWDRRRLGDALFVAMMTASWVAGNALAVLGCVVATFLLVAHGDFTLFMAEVDNIAARFVAASPERQAVFEREAAITLGLVGAVLLLLRLPRFLARLRLELAREDSHANRRA